MTQLAIKIDVDTERGTRLGVPGLLDLLEVYKIPATFLFSLGPDNTGRAIRRIFRPGFLKKVSRTSVLKVYGWRTLLNGIVLPGPHIGRLHGAIMRQVKLKGHEVGIHCYDHIRWQDGLATMNMRTVRDELGRARKVYRDIFEEDAQTAGAAGWQANAQSLQAYDEAGFLYGSDCRGKTPFFPKADDRTFQTLQIPTTLPTLDELLGRPEYPLEKLVDHYVKLLQPNTLNVLTIHTELEGMLYKDWFENLLNACKKKGVAFVLLADVARDLLKSKDAIPVCELLQGEVDGRSGTLAVQGN
ncbi:MAG: 4-deoxy-4-formamido-L-arabinose-phosphoundecaprenol deformylase [Alphaproteobacteria bacterium]|nr:4-deoxy-4-formamido-L-arabinose-phosphoundecaprenol deformylase [Alphaproteobacteria bacterium]